jgi:hypothetical protein
MVKVIINVRNAEEFEKVICLLCENDIEFKLQCDSIDENIPNNTETSVETAETATDSEVWTTDDDCEESDEWYV